MVYGKMNLKLLKEPRIIILIFFLIFSLVAISPRFGVDGVSIQNVAKNSAAAIANIPNPEPGISPVSREVIHFINGREISDLQDYYESVSELKANTSLLIETNKDIYTIKVLPKINLVDSGKTERVETVKLVNGTNQTIIEEKIIYDEVIEGVEDIGLTVLQADSSNIRKGLDLSGGTRVILQPETEVTNEEFETLLDITDKRLNAFGLSDIVVREASSGVFGEGDKFISVEIPGANQKAVIDLLSQQGKFEAKIGDTVVFSEGDDVRSLCSTPECSGVRNCGTNEAGWTCQYEFEITLSPAAAKKQADATKDLQIIGGGSNGYLDKPLQLILDGELVNELQIGASLKGAEVTTVTISGPGTGNTRTEAVEDAENSLKQMQTLLRSGSLPVKLEIVKTDQLSPTLGSEFTKNLMLVAVLSIIAVVSVIFIRYKKLSVSLPIIITMISEAIIILGVASLIKWNIDLAAVAGIIIAIGTGVDDQIVIIDESLSKTGNSQKDRMKRAFFIIMAAYFTTLVAMIPLGFAGAGLLKGFAITTVLGVSIGVFITRPAYAKILEYLNQ